MLTPRGMVTLTMNGKAVTKLSPGRYTFSITDRNAHASFALLGPKTPKKQDLTGGSFVGKKSIAVTLTAGRWTLPVRPRSDPLLHRRVLTRSHGALRALAR